VAGSSTRHDMDIGHLGGDRRGKESSLQVGEGSTQQLAAALRELLDIIPGATDRGLTASGDMSTGI